MAIVIDLLKRSVLVAFIGFTISSPYVGASASLETLVVRTPYENTRGIFERVDGAATTFQCTEKGMFLYRFGADRWLIGPKEGQTQGYHVLQSSSDHPADQEWGGGIQVLRLSGLISSVYDDDVLVYSKYPQVQGVYRRTKEDHQATPKDHEFFPSYAIQGMHLWHNLILGKWEMGPTLGSTEGIVWMVDSDAFAPTNIASELFTADSVVSKMITPKDLAPDLTVVPSSLVLKSKYAEFAGIFERDSHDFQFYPVYRTGNWQIYHDLFSGHWVLAKSGTGREYVWQFKSDAANLLRVTPEQLTASDVVDGFGAVDTTLPDDSACPSEIAVFSSFGNIRGLYKRDAADYEHFPVYINEAGGSIWHGGGHWFHSKQAGDAQTFWSVNSDASCPSDIKQDMFNSIDALDKLVPLSDLIPKDASCASEIVIFSKYNNLRGIFTKHAEHQYYPAYSGNDLHIYHDILSGVWKASKQLGGAEAVWSVLSNTPCPETIEQTVIHAVNIDSISTTASIPPDVTPCPSVVILISNFSNIRGGYERQDASFQFYPVFKSSKEDQYIWHDLYNHMWLCTSKIGTRDSVFWTVPGDASCPLAITSQELRNASGSPDRIEAWTWGAHDPSYGPEETLYTSVSFPPKDESIGKSLEEFKDTADVSGKRGLVAGRALEWVRARDLNRDEPDVLWNNVDINDIHQGSIGDCWLIAAIAELAKFPTIIKDVFRTQELVSDGRYTIHLFDVRKGSTGEWTELIIDDWIPAGKRDKYDRYAEMLFARATAPGELWPILLEKAFAQLVGSYSALQNGDASFAWQAMTSCMPKTYARSGTAAWTLAHNDLEQQRKRLTEDPKKHRTDLAFVGDRQEFESLQLFHHLRELDAHGQIIAASISSEADAGVSPGYANSMGLVVKHQFSVLAVTEAKTNGGEIFQLIRLRNPWGNEKSWTGAWSNHDEAWQRYPEVERYIEQEIIGGVRSTGDDGIFWMTWEDFSRIFTNVDSCTIPDAVRHVLDESHKRRSQRLDL